MPGRTIGGGERLPGPVRGAASTGGHGCAFPDDARHLRVPDIEALCGKVDPARIAEFLPALAHIRQVPDSYRDE